MSGGRKYTNITQLDVNNILRNLDRGATIDFVSKKYLIARRIIAEIKVTREKPEKLSIGEHSKYIESIKANNYHDHLIKRLKYKDDIEAEEGYYGS